MLSDFNFLVEGVSVATRLDEGARFLLCALLPSASLTIFLPFIQVATLLSAGSFLSTPRTSAPQMPAPAGQTPLRSLGFCFNNANLFPFVPAALTGTVGS